MDRISLFKALSNDIRLKVLQFLLEGRMCVSAIVEKLNVTQPTVTQHLKILQAAGLVKSEKVGYWMHYSIDREGLLKAKREIEDFINAMEIKEKECKVPPSRCPEKTTKAT